MEGLLIPKHGSGLRRLLMAHAMAGQQLVEQTATGNPATFTTTVAKTLLQCKVNFAPVQSGSGDPSPTNVRPITGWTGVNVYHSGSDTRNPTTYPVTWTSQGTVYGGYVDLVRGVAVAEYYYFKGGWTQYTSGNGYKGYYKLGVPIRDTVNGYNASNMLSMFGTVPSTLIDNRIQPPRQGSSSVQCYLSLDENYSADDVEYCYRIATPIEYPLSPQQITTLIGTNNVWSDANGDITVKYMTKGA